MENLRWIMEYSCHDISDNKLHITAAEVQQAHPIFCIQCIPLCTELNWLLSKINITPIYSLSDAKWSPFLNKNTVFSHTAVSLLLVPSVCMSQWLISCSPWWILYCRLEWSRPPSRFATIMYRRSPKETRQRTVVRIRDGLYSRVN